jgi:energy-coupling factor transporter ATP-binding protein EcfA2
MRITSLLVHEIGPFSEDVKLSFRPGNDSDRADTVLFVGPNGSGKSTLLYAIAGCLGQSDDLGRRMWSDESSVELMVETGSGPYQHAFATRSLSITADPGQVVLGGSAYGQRYSLVIPNAISPRAFTDDVTGKADSVPLLFAYSGTRTSAQGAHVNPLDSSPSNMAASFEKPFAFGTFEAWVGDVMGRRDSALVANETEKAREVSVGLSQIEELLKNLTGTETVFVRNFDNGAIELKTPTSQVELDLIPEGLKSILSWLGDLLRRLYKIKTGGIPHHELPIVLLLDEIDVHLHPKWQRLILPAVERLLPKAQIFLTTHSPFVVGSASDAQIVWLGEGGKVVEENPKGSLRGVSYPAVLELMGIDSLQDDETSRQLHSLDEVVAQVRSGAKAMADFEAAALKLPQTEDVAMIVDFQRSQLLRQARPA